MIGMSSQTASCPASFLTTTLMHLHQSPDTEGRSVAYGVIIMATRNDADTLQA